MNRRAFLKLPALLPLIAFDAAKDCERHEFQYEGVIGTSMDLVVWTANSRLAENACRTVLEEIDRLSSILNTRDPTSEVSLLEANRIRNPSPELTEVFDMYDYWERRTGGIFSIRPAGPDTPRNVDALGKAYIIDHALKAARREWPAVQALLVNIGGDIAVWGQSCKIDVADPDAWYDNAGPIATITLKDAAVATSGTYARGAHLINPRDRQSLTATAATVIAPDVMTANALATTLCLTKADAGLQLVESIPGAEALRIESGILQRTSGFAMLEQPLFIQTPATTNWPPGYHLKLTLPLKAGRSTKRPYVAVWVEDSSGELVRILAIFGNKSKYFADLWTAWKQYTRNQNQFKSVARATRPAGRYDLEWDGLDKDHRPVPLGEYRITVETNQEHGTYAKQAGSIRLGDSPTSITLPATANFDEVLVEYGPR